jgi:hypothetical protein
VRIAKVHSDKVIKLCVDEMIVICPPLKTGEMESLSFVDLLELEVFKKKQSIGNIGLKSGIAVWHQIQVDINVTVWHSV